MIANLAADTQAFTSNVFLVDGDRPVLIDAGANFDVVSATRQHVDDIEALVLTHTHPDHVGNVDEITEAFDVESWGFDTAHEAVDREIEDGEYIQLGDRVYEALHTPGHAPDHLCFYADDGGILFAGDLIFAQGGFGRTDLEGADRETLLRSLDRVVERVNSSLQELHAGHGPSVTTDAGWHVNMARRGARSL